MKNFCVRMAIAGLLLLAGACDDDDDKNGGSGEDINLTLVTEGLTAPVAVMESPDNSGRIFIVDQPGIVYIMKGGQRLQQPFLDIRNKIVALNIAEQDERGLLGLTFHPDFASNGKFYVYYSAPLQAGAPAGWNHTSHIAEFKVSAGNADVADAASERTVLLIDKPQANHNAGMVGFGHDGFLYISVGDGGGGNDVGTGHVADWYAQNEGGNGQNVDENLLGKILRIDVNTGSPYGIPADNPLAGKDGRDEIYAFGFRNPYRFCFDPSGQMILADAGQELYEEIDLVQKGGNYGWNVKEGRHCFSTADPDTPPSSCPTTDEDGNPLIDPVIEFKNSKSFSDGLGNVSIGGFVYQGTLVPALSGKYIFGVLTKGDQPNGAIFAADRSGNDWPYEKLNVSNMGTIGFVLGFGQDKAGEVYVLVNNGQPNQGGKVYKIDAKQ
jgi:glucose/arabinose dehydrogenase